MGKRQKPGETPSKPGEYTERGPRGGAVQKPRTVTIESGDTPLPPTQEPGRTWERTGPPKTGQKIERLCLPLQSTYWQGKSNAPAR